MNKKRFFNKTGLTLCLVGLFALSGCQRDRGVFFSNETLSDHHCEQLPRPDLSSAMMTEKETILLTMTDEEYAAYAERIFGKLIDTPEYLLVGTYQMHGSQVEILPYYTYGTDGGAYDFTADEHRFVYLTGYAEHGYSTFYCITLDRFEETRLAFSRYRYNTKLTLSSRQWSHISEGNNIM